MSEHGFIGIMGAEKTFRKLETNGGIERFESNYSKD